MINYNADIFFNYQMGTTRHQQDEYTVYNNCDIVNVRIYMRHWNKSGIKNRKFKLI